MRVTVFAGGSLVTAALQARLLYEFPEPVFVENIILRGNGDLLLTTFDRGRLYALDPEDPEPLPRLVVEVPGVTGLTGIAEVKPDVFAVTGGVTDLANQTWVDGTATVATVEFPRGGHCNASSEGVVATLFPVPNVEILNGMDALPGRPGMILSAGSKEGQIYRIDTATGATEVAIRDPVLAIGQNPNVTLGVNGVKVFHGHLYVSNSGQGLFARVQIDAEARPLGDFEVLARVPPSAVPFAYDDFVVAKDGTAYVALQRTGVVRIGADGTQTVLLGPGTGSDVELRSPTAAFLSKDESKLYVTSAGISGVDGTVGGGQIVEITL